MFKCSSYSWKLAPQSIDLLAVRVKILPVASINPTLKIPPENPNFKRKANASAHVNNHHPYQHTPLERRTTASPTCTSANAASVPPSFPIEKRKIIYPDQASSGPAETAIAFMQGWDARTLRTPRRRAKRLNVLRVMEGSARNLASFLAHPRKTWL